MRRLEDLPREELVESLRRALAENEELKAANAELSERLAKLERLVSRNSGNSSTPPSKDDDLGRKPPVGRVKPATGDEPRKRGKQRGAPGFHMAFKPVADEYHSYRPAGTCECGRDLADARDLGVVARHQQTEIPEITAKTVQHDRHAAYCACGRTHTAPLPEGVPDTPTSFGPNLVTWCVYLMVVHSIPVERCADILESLTGTRPSDGFVHHLLYRAAAAVKQANRTIYTLLTLAHAVSVDETPLRVGPKKVKKYLLVACTELYTWFMLGDRSLTTFRKFILPDLTGVIVHDRYCNYDNVDFAHLAHQLCAQHLIRDLEDAAECSPTATWPVQIQRALKDLIHAANTARAAGPEATSVPAALAAPALRAFNQGVLVGLKELAGKPGDRPADFLALLTVLHTRPGDVLRFVTDLRVPPTSNQAERDLRPAKISVNRPGVGGLALVG
ncbi:MAG: transposase [Dactylosporangium sp.]|nr:transposase [Dactylosporangium sp.]NNJ61528.1 transposase [Dactylosporangium sp.]